METETVRRRFPHHPASVRRARHDLLTWLADSGVNAEGASDTAALVMSELVANAVLHASALPDGTLEVAWRREGQTLQIEVTDADGGSVSPHCVVTDAHSVGPRGLAIVDSLTLDWGVWHHDGHQTVHAHVSMS